MFRSRSPKARRPRVASFATRFPSCSARVGPPRSRRSLWRRGRVPAMARNSRHSGFLDARVTVCNLRPVQDVRTRALGGESVRANRAGEDGRVAGAAGDGGGLKAVSATRRRRWIRVVSMLVPLAVALVASASASALTVRGSAEQVYATGLPANAQVTLSRRGIVRSQNADSL